MSTPKLACPITCACLHIIRQSRDTSPALFSIFVGEEDNWGELEEEARTNAPSIESQRLRAFYAIEVIYHELLPQLFFSISDPLDRYPKRIGGIDNSQQLAELLQRPNKVLKACESAAEALKKSLRSSNVGLSVVGSALGHSLVESSETLDNIQNHLVILLTITTRKAVSPWNRQTFQA